MRILSALILFFLILAFSVFAIINRAMVEVNFDFLSLLDPAFAGDRALVFVMPLFLAIFGAGLIGMLIGMLLPLMNFFRKTRIQLQEKLRQPLRKKPTPPNN